jgi:hypothetical protein
MAHELGHVKSGHVLYYQIAEFLPVITEAIGAGFWRAARRRRADRAPELAPQVGAHGRPGRPARRAGPASRAQRADEAGRLPQRCNKDINVDDFVAQARAFEGMDSDS